MRYFLSVLIVILTACGGNEDECGGKDVYGQKQKDCPASDLAAIGDQIDIKGSVVGVFDVTVDGDSYDDTEDFYTQELAALPAKIQALGYDGYDVSFDAEVGYKDLTNDMTVFLAPADDDRGYASKTIVRHDGSFKFTVEVADAADVWRVKANKRIALTLFADGQDTLKFCYNFSAVEQDFEYSDLDKPIVLSDFTTKITAYDCDTADQKDGLQIPAKE